MKREIFARLCDQGHTGIRIIDVAPIPKNLDTSKSKLRVAYSDPNHDHHIIGGVFVNTSTNTITDESPATTEQAIRREKRRKVRHTKIAYSRAKKAVA
jgi:hypothetical protein